MEFLDYVRALRRHAALILLLALLGGGAAYAYAVRQAPRYESNSTVLVSLQSAGTIGDANLGTTYAQQIVKTYADVAVKPFVLDRVIDSLRLDTTAAELAKDVEVTASAETTLIDVTVTAASPRRAADIADAISRQLGRTVDAVTPTIRGRTAPVKLTVVEEAQATPEPVSPNVALTVAAGGLGGAALMIAIALLRTVLDTRIRRVEDVRGAVDAPILGRILRSSAVRKYPLIVRHDPGGRVAEAFRSLRTNLQFLDVDRTSNASVISSSTEGEGKTTTVVNLALTIADAGAKVLVIDADLRRPRLASCLRLDGSVGLTDVLIGRVRLDDALQRWGDGALTVLPAGVIPPNPSELLQSGAMTDLLRKLEARFDTVLIDAPPLLPVSDAAILSTRAAGTMLVCATGSTARGQLAEAAARVRQVGGRVLGVVLTKVPVDGAEAASYARYEYKPKPQPRVGVLRRHALARTAASRPVRPPVV